MTTLAVQRARRFNREVAERIGALTDDFLGRARPMGEARVLWEIGPEGTEVRALRTRLTLDSGYMSRVLRSLERQSLVTVGPSPEDEPASPLNVESVHFSDTSQRLSTRQAYASPGPSSGSNKGVKHQERCGTAELGS